MKILLKSVLLIIIAGLSTTAVAQQRGSNPTPFNTDPIKQESERATPTNDIEREIQNERERSERRPRSGADVLKQAGDNLIDNADLPKPVLPELPEVPLPTTVEDIYKEAEDFRVRGTINGANVEYSRSQNIYRISGGNVIEDKQLPKPLTVKKGAEGYELATGGKESLPTQLKQEEKGEE